MGAVNPAPPFDSGNAGRPERHAPAVKERDFLIEGHFLDDEIGAGVRRKARLRPCMLRLGRTLAHPRPLRHRSCCCKNIVPRTSAPERTIPTFETICMSASLNGVSRELSNPVSLNLTPEPEAARSPIPAASAQVHLQTAPQPMSDTKGRFRRKRPFVPNKKARKFFQRRRKLYAAPKLMIG